MSNIQIIVSKDGIETVSAFVTSSSQVEVLKFIQSITPAIRRLDADARKQSKKAQKVTNVR